MTSTRMVSSDFSEDKGLGGMLSLSRAQKPGLGVQHGVNGVFVALLVRRLTRSLYISQVENKLLNFLDLLSRKGFWEYRPLA